MLVIGCCGERFYSDQKPRVVKNLLTNWRPLSVNMYEGILNGINQFLENIFTFCVKPILVVGIARVNFETLSITILIC